MGCCLFPGGGEAGNRAEGGEAGERVIADEALQLRAHVGGKRVELLNQVLEVGGQIVEVRRVLELAERLAQGLERVQRGGQIGCPRADGTGRVHGGIACRAEPRVDPSFRLSFRKGIRCRCQGRFAGAGGRKKGGERIRAPARLGGCLEAGLGAGLEETDYAACRHDLLT